jgi:hypothetical protein
MHYFYVIIIYENRGGNLKELKKIIIFNNKRFYNARHLYNYLQKYYRGIHPVTYFQVEDATGKRLQSIDKFFKVTYDYVVPSQKQKIKRWVPLIEGYEEIIAFDIKCFDDFIIKYAGTKTTTGIYTFRNTRQELMLAFKPNSLISLAKKYSKDLWEKHYEKIFKDSELKENKYYYYNLKPTDIKQNIF